MPRRKKRAAIVGALAALGGSAFLPAARVTLQNGTAEPLTQVAADGRCLHEELGEIPPGESVTLWFSPRGETSVFVSFRANGNVVEADGDVYISRGPPSGHMISVSTGGSVRGRSDGSWPFLLLPRVVREGADHAITAAVRAGADILEAHRTGQPN